MKNNIKNITKKIMNTMYPLIVFVVIMSMISIIIGVAQPYLLGCILDELTINGLIPYHYILVSLVVVVSSFLTNWLQNFYWFKMIFKGDYLARSEFFSKLLKRDVNFFNNHQKGDLVNRSLNEVGQYIDYYMLRYPMLILNVFRIAIVMLILFYMNLYMALLVVFLCIIYFFYYKILNKKLRASMINEREAFSSLMSVTNESLDGIATIKLFNSEGYFSNRFQNKTYGHFIFSTKLQMWKSMGQSGKSFLIDLMPFAVVIVSSYFILNGRITIGIIFSFVNYLGYLYEPIANLTDLNIMKQQGKAVEKRVAELISDDEEDEGNKRLPHIDKIVFKNMSFTYDGKKEIFKDLDICIKKGQKVAVTGPSGVGKSTLVKLLLGHENPTKGAVLINDINLQDINKTDYKNKLVILPQDIFVFNASQRDNITLGQGIDDHTINKAVKLSRLKNKSDEDVLKYSGGERQRIGLARIFAKDADFIILDEPTSALDMETEHEVIENLKHFIERKDAILFVISHRKEILSICDYNLVLAENGQYEINKKVKPEKKKR